MLFNLSIPAFCWDGGILLIRAEHSTADGAGLFDWLLELPSLGLRLEVIYRRPVKLRLFVKPNVNCLPCAVPGIGAMVGDMTVGGRGWGQSRSTRPGSLARLDHPWRW